ncbi:S-adenosylmethionine:tRNA ribosyltransferase-isomerase [uncultured Porphyromonas sp.]|uniref:S-adenosylmethionine:tRNA ribosyltransferase-isomerase n=1 Tax=uncultured Porphyromonas sp. TaxID=159274 RepID=UPI002605FAC5|nr:S-adenosylmethionine:tRNA ribosyltransferase-isomerase [uncultured Porphyromonas sp.]
MEDYKHIRISDYSYPLPEERIAKYPLAERDHSKLLHLSPDGTISEHHFYDLPGLLAPEDLMVMNDTRVINARVVFHRPTGARIEVFCLDPYEPKLYEESFASHHSVTWHCMIGNASKWKEDRLTRPISGGTLSVERVGDGLVRFSWDTDGSFADILEEVGELPIPPYLNRDTEASDLVTYQTVYARIEGSVAAPTAGLHFTDRVLRELEERGVRQTRVTLHVGAGTFAPVKSSTMGGHEMHKEVIKVPLEALRTITEQKRAGRQIVSVGTTSTRTLESLYYMGINVLDGVDEPLHVSQWMPYERVYEVSVPEALDALIRYLEESGSPALIGDTQIIIEPGFEYRLVDKLITNFHQPVSTLMLLVAAFVGERWREIYRFALDHDFRFLSYGDSNLLEKPLTK